MDDGPNLIGLVNDGTGRWALWNRQDDALATAVQYVRGDIHAARISALEAERDEALNQLDSMKHSVDVLERRSGEFMAERDRLAAGLKDAVEALRDLADALDAVDAEADRAEKPGALAWSSTPVVRALYARKAAHALLARLEAREASGVERAEGDGT